MDKQEKPKQIGKIVEDEVDLPNEKIQKSANLSSTILIVISICLIVVAVTLILIRVFNK